MQLNMVDKNENIKPIGMIKLIKNAINSMLKNIENNGSITRLAIRLIGEIYPKVLIKTGSVKIVADNVTAKLLAIKFGKWILTKNFVIDLANTSMPNTDKNDSWKPMSIT